MKQLNFDGRLLEGKDFSKKIRDIAIETDFSGNEYEELFLYKIPSRKYYHRKKFFIYK
ncbi:MAG: hypothetical protein HFJ59_06065 [Clostridia bacterium]|nr:hypothetical protein [Clostridia bacterium]